MGPGFPVVRAISSETGIEDQPILSDYEKGRTGHESSCVNRTCKSLHFSLGEGHHMAHHNEKVCLYWTICRLARSLALSPDLDVIADTYASTGQVILAAALTGQTKPESLVDLTSLPLPFVETVIDYSRAIELWSAESFLDLGRNVAHTPLDLLEVDHSIRSANDDFWESPLVDDLPLHIYRGQIVLGGTERWYPDDDDAEDLSRRLHERIERFAALD
jgi:hypothetical protein